MKTTKFYSPVISLYVGWKSFVCHVLIKLHVDFFWLISWKIDYVNQCVLLLFDRLLDPQTEGEISSYLVSQIIFCARGPSNSTLACCWAFTTSRRSTSINQNLNGKTQQEILYQCQIFRCENQDAVSFFSLRKNENWFIDFV